MLKCGQTVGHVHRDERSRGNAFVLTERDGNYAILCQALPRAARLINNLAEHEFDRVSVPSLYDASLRSGWTKRKWRVEKMPIEKAASAFNDQKSRAKWGLICGDRNTYQVL